MRVIAKAPSGAVWAVLPDGRRQHFQHGPIDLVIEAWGDDDAPARAYRAAWAVFETLLPDLVREVGVLRRPLDRGQEFDHPVAQRMATACTPYADQHVTPMAAVAGAVADHVLGAMTAAADLRRAYVNDGGDIAVHLSPGEAIDLGVVSDVSAPALDGRARIGFADPVRGIATSGWRGRSLSLGIADAVTVLAKTAAAADVAATLIANAVDTDHPAVVRHPASALDPDTDLGDRPVTVAVGPLPPEAIAGALDRGVAEAERYADRGLITAALLRLSGNSRSVGKTPPALLGAAA